MDNYLPDLAPSPADVIPYDRTKLSTSARAWAAYQGGRDSYFPLISIYIFMPYVATVLIGNAVKGQSMIAAPTCRPAAVRRSQNGPR